MELFTVSILCYRNFEFLKDAIESVCMQDYPQIELIVSDDGSECFPTDEIIKFIKKRKGDNIISFSVLEAPTNRGTVRHLNELISQSNGEYLVFLAADDALYDAHVLTRYVEGYRHATDDCHLEMAQTAMYDYALEHFEEYYMGGYIQSLIEGQVDYDRLYQALCISPCLPTTSTCYRKSFFEIYGKFDENYFLIEDYPLHIRIAQDHIPFHYENFIAIKHRNGGISHGAVNAHSQTRLRYYNDLQRCHETILESFCSVAPENEKEIRRLYGHQKIFFDYQRLGTTHNIMDFLKLFCLHPFYSATYAFSSFHDRFGRLTFKMLAGLICCWVILPIACEAASVAFCADFSAFVAVGSSIINRLWVISLILCVVDSIGWLVQKIHSFPNWVIYTCV